MELVPSKEQELRHAFSNVGVTLGGEFYIPAASAGQFVRKCIQLSLAIFGVELFMVLGNKITPDLSNIADYSSMIDGDQEWLFVVEETANETFRFLAQLPTSSNLLLNFIVGEASSS